MIPTTRPPRGRSGSRDHALVIWFRRGRGPLESSRAGIWRAEDNRTASGSEDQVSGRGCESAAWARSGEIEGLRWLARVGPAPIDAWGCAMGWAPGNARSHAARLTRERWLARVARPRGEGSLFFATRQGVQVAGVDVPPAPAPAPIWWDHLAACAWVAAWLTVRGREMVGPRELIADRSWQGELKAAPGSRRLVHTPDLVGIVPGPTSGGDRGRVGAQVARLGFERFSGCTRGGSRAASSARASTCAGTTTSASSSSPRPSTSGSARRTGAFAWRCSRRSRSWSATRPEPFHVERALAKAAR